MKIRTLILAGAALVALPTAGHACSFSGQNSALIGPLLGDASSTGGPVTVDQLAEAFSSHRIIKPAFERSGCTPAQVKAKFVTLNGGNGAEVRPRSGSIVIPTPDSAAIAKPAPAAAQAEPTPAASTAPAPQTQFEAKPFVQSIPAAAPAAVAPKSVIHTTETQRVELSSEQKAQLTSLSERNEQLQAQIDLINAKPNPTESDLAALAELTKAKGEIGKQILALSGRVNTLTNDVSGMWNWIYGIIVLMVLGFTLLWWRKPGRKALAETNAMVLDLDNRTSANTTEIVKFKERVFKHIVERIDGLTHTPAQMKALKVGDKFTYHLQVDGGQVGFNVEKTGATPSGDALVKVDVLQKPVTAKILFRELADYIEADGMLPALKLVNTP